MVLLSRRLPLRVLAVVVAAVSTLAPAAGQQRDLGEDAIKAAYLYNFTKFVEWPDRAFSDAAAPFTVCVMADEAFRRALEEALANERVRGRAVRLAVLSGAEELKACHVAYFGRAESETSNRRLGDLRQAPVLTVGEGRKFLEQGGHIAFLVEGNRVRFAISKPGADAAGLNVSSKLLRLGRPAGAPAP